MRGASSAASTTNSSVLRHPLSGMLSRKAVFGSFSPFFSKTLKTSQSMQSCTFVPLAAGRRSHYIRREKPETASLARRQCESHLVSHQRIATMRLSPSPRKERTYSLRPLSQESTWWRASPSSGTSLRGSPAHGFSGTPLHGGRPGVLCGIRHSTTQLPKW